MAVLADGAKKRFLGLLRSPCPYRSFVLARARNERERQLGQGRIPGQLVVDP
jgi:hypothetical protein